MAKKRVKYSFGNSAKYAAIAKKDPYTIYFVYDTVKDSNGKDVPAEFGTIYKGATRIGSAKASDIVFDTELQVTVLQGETAEDSVFYVIEPGTSLTDFVDGLLKQVGTWDQSLYSQFVGDGTPENPGILLSTIRQESSFDEHGNGLGTISNAINDAINRSITPQADGGTEVISSWVNEHFVSNDKLGQIQELAGILDDETVELLVNAATGIQNVLRDYYTKEEADEKLKDVLFFNTYDAFPEAGDSSILYVDCDENILYRWGVETPEDSSAYYIPVGGSGAGTGDVKTETSIYVRGGKTTVSVAKGTNLVVDYIFSSAYTQMKYNKRIGEFEKVSQETGTVGRVRYYLDGVQFDSGDIKQSSYDENAEEGVHVNAYNRITVAASRLVSTTHELKIVCTDRENNTATETIYINVISASINSSYVPTPTNLNSNVRIPVSIVSTTDAELFYTIDDEDVVKVQDVPVGSPVITISIAPTTSGGETRSHGYHTVKIWATTFIEESGTTIQTSVLSYDIIWYESGNSLPIITTSYNVEKNDDGIYDLTQYEYATLKYQVYSNGGQTTVVDLNIKNVNTGDIRTVNTLEVDSISKSWTYTFNEVGVYLVYIDAHYDNNGEDAVVASEKYTVNVKKSDISMDATPGSVLYFTAKDRSNNEANPAVWTDRIGNVEAQLDNFLWNENSGWHTNGATTSLRVAGGARCTIPYMPFDTDKRGTGQVIEFDFETSNLSDATATVISCQSESDNSGIEITATGAYFSSNEFGYTTDGDARIHVPFKEGERIRLSFVITPWMADEEGHGKDDPQSIINLWDGTKYVAQNTVENGWWRFVKVYINGICVSINNYNSSFVQSNPASIVIGSDKATVDIFSIRAYDTVLYDRAIVNNFIADTQDPVEKLRLFKRNNILNVTGTDVEPSALRRLMPCLFITCQSDATTSGIVNNEHILPTNKADKRGVTMFFDCDGLDDDARKYYNFCHTFVAFNVQFTVQGTSSQYYPRRNWKATIKSEKKYKDDYVGTVTGSKPTYVFVDTPWEEDIKNGRDARAMYAAKYKDKYYNKYQLKDFSEDFTGISDERRTVDEISSIPCKKFCLKADFAESSGTHNTGLAKYVDFIMKSMGYDYLTPPQKAQYNKTRNMVDVTFRTSVDGYPIAMFWRPTFEDSWEFYGKFNFNIDKGAESTFGFIDLDDGGITAEDINPTTGFPFVEFNEDYYDAASQADRLLYEPPVECWEFTNNSTDLCKFRNVTPTSFTEKSKDADGVTELPSWLGSFEARHPDNDNMNELDYGTGLKKPVHWASFSEWVSSTDRTGYHNYDKNLPVPTLWSGTYEELVSGASEKEIFATYEGKLTELIAEYNNQINTPVVEPEPEEPENSEETENSTTPSKPLIDPNRRYILQPVAIDPGDGTISPDQSYDLYGHIVHYNSQDSAWYDENAELNTWVDDGPYVEEESTVDYSKAYYIGNDVYSFNKTTSTWDRIAALSSYALDAPVTYNMITYEYDTAEYRFAKFKYDLPKHMNIPVTTAYYVMTEFFGCADQRAKNMMFASWGYEPGASKVKPANTYSNEAAANAAGYKGVYSYEIGTIAAAKTPTRSANEVLSAPATRGLVLGAAPSTVCINEISPNDKKMELYNPTDSDISILGYTLKGKDETGADRDDWTVTSSFVGGTTIPAHGYTVLEFIKTKDGGDGTKGPQYGLSKSALWSFKLLNANAEEIDSATNEGHEALGTKSWGRLTDGAETWVEFDTPTIGAANAGGVEPETYPATELSSHLSYTTNATELSGLCFNADKTGLFGVGDTGKVYSIAFDGTTTDLNIAEVNEEDLEGITIDSNGDLFAINERSGKVWKIAAPAYNTAVEAFTVTTVGENPSSNGFEGIAAFGNNFIVGNQKNPIALYTVTSLGGTPTLLAELDCVSEIADVEYDGTNIWVLDSSESTLVKLTATGEFVAKYSMPFIPTTDNGPESLAIDGNIAFIGCDNTNKDLFKLSLVNDPLTTTVVFNEFDPDFKLFELYNTASSDIDLTGYSMTKENDETTKFTFGNITLPANGRLVLPFKSDGIAGPTFGCSAEKGFEYKLFDTEGNVVDRIDNLTDKVVIAEGQTLGRILDGADEFVLFKHHGSIGKSNAEGVLNSSELYISEIDPHGNSIGKRFEIYNAGASPIDLTGYSFVKDDKTWTVVNTAVGEGLGLPSLIIAAESRMVIQCNNTKTATEVSPKKDASKWPDFGISADKGFILEIKDANGNVLDRVDYVDGFNPFFVEIPEGKTVGFYPETDGVLKIFDIPTIGEAKVDGTSIISLFEAKPVSEDVKVVINEISPSTDTIELYNLTNNTISLKGYSLVKKGESMKAWKFPANASIEGNGYYVINCKQWNEAVGPTFGLSATDGFYLTIAEIVPRSISTDPSTGEITYTVLNNPLDSSYGLADKNSNNLLVIHDIVNNLSTSENFITLTGNYSIGRTPDGASEWKIYEVSSIGESNANGTVYEPEELDPGALITDHVVINEINGTTKMIELYNPTSSAVNLGNYGLLKVDQDAYSAGDWFTFPAGASIPGHGYFTVCADKVKTGADANLHTEFGISLNPGKVFHLYLISYTPSLDTTSKESILSTGVVVDDIDNLTNPVNYENKDEGLSYGRVNDGSENWTLFNIDSMAKTTGPSSDTKLSNINGQAKANTEIETGTIKTVLYWVPINAEYIWYPIFYDNDTILSLDNTGHIKFNPNVESTDKVGTGYAYNGTESVLWVNFKDAYDAEIRSTYVNMRSKGGLTYANCMKYFNTSQSAQWPENVYNIDGKFKYVIPATKGYTDYSSQDETGKYGVLLRNSTYLYECQGSREEHRKWWLSNRFTYMDSRYFAVEYAEDYATIRLYTPSLYAGVEPSSTFKLTPYADMYLRVMFGQIVSTLRAEKNKTYDIIPSDPNLRFNDTETIIYGASNILSFGDMTNKYAGSVAIDKASKITDIILGADEPYYNENITKAGLTIGAGNTTLKNLDLRGCTKLNSISGLNQITSIEKVDARRTGITSFDFSTNGANLNEVWYANAVTDIKLVNMKNISERGIHIPTYDNLKTLWIENCPQLKNTSWNIVNNILSTPRNMLSVVRLSGFEWTINTNAAYETWNKLIKLKGYDQSGIQSLSLPYLSGTVKIGGEVRVSSGYAEGMEAMFRDAGGLRVIVNPANIVNLNGIKIVPEKDILDGEGTAVITPNKPFKFNISYLPDNFVLSSNKGVTWNITGINSNLEIVEQAEDHIILNYHGSTAGTDLFSLEAVSTYDNTLTYSLHIRPSATLTKIKVTNTLGQELGEEYFDINEGATTLLHVDFLPEGTDDTGIVFAAGNSQHFTYSYDADTKDLTITGNDVSRDQACSLVLTSQKVPTIKKVLNFTVHNIVSRIIKLKNAAGDTIPGYIVVDYTDSTGNTVTDTFTSTTGVITLRTDGSCGFGELKVTPHANEEAIRMYNQPKTIIIPELPTDALQDDVTEVTFFEPITATITINNAGAPVIDRKLIIKSAENETYRALTTPPYNNVICGKQGNGAPATIQLLANTEHHITITEIDETTGALVTSGGRYSQYSGIISTGTSDDNYTIILSRDYLGNINDDTELHMTIVTGTDEGMNVARLFVKTRGEITINWGDQEDGNLNYTTTINNSEDFDRELTLYHVYGQLGKEYDITVTENTQRIQWFHVVREGSQYLTPCIGTTQSSDGFEGSAKGFTWRMHGNCGLVAYQSIGGAEITTLPTFRIPEATDKQYCKVLSVGNIFKRCTTATSAEELFLNSTVEQLYSGAMFGNCRNITSFRSTFENSNITLLPTGFFLQNTKAVNFSNTFKGCVNLTSINSAADVTFIKQDPGVQVETLAGMFEGCKNLTSQVPAFWITYYGCSFCANTPQQTYNDCDRVRNREDIPGVWGGPVAKTYIEDAYKELEYLDTSGIFAGGGYAEFILSNIFPKAHYKYVYEVEFTNNNYEMIPLFGCAQGTTDGTTTTIESVVDFSRGGSLDGTNAGSYTGYMPYRINTIPDGVFSGAWDDYTAQPAKVFGSITDENAIYGKAGNRITIDISYTTEGKVTIYPYGLDPELYKKDYTLNDWNKENTVNWRATLPLKLMNIYNTLPIADGTAREHNYDTVRGCNIKFYKLSIYDDDAYKTLVHEIIPVYGRIANTNTLSAFLYDTVTNKTYNIMSNQDALTKLKYYSKKS